MQHSFYFDGNQKRIAWSIENNSSKTEQTREHATIYLDKVTNSQSKLIALHVGIFWGIGRFIIKDNDKIKVMVEDKSIMEYLSKNKTSSDELIRSRIHFINQLINQRKLKMEYESINPEKNYISKLIEGKGS